MTCLPIKFGLILTAIDLVLYIFFDEKYLCISAEMKLLNNSSLQQPSSEGFISK
jgi:hypothetical protein